jgi:hypothetical protein
VGSGVLIIDCNVRLHECLTAFLVAYEEPAQLGETFRAIDTALAEAPGHLLFTVLARHPALKPSERSYSNQPLAYLIGGRRPMTDSP